MKILVVDDEKTIVKGIKFNLENEGYQVETGYDGEEAVELAREGKCIILISSEMPELLGMVDRLYVMNEGAFVAEMDFGTAPAPAKPAAQ